MRLLGMAMVAVSIVAAKSLDAQNPPSGTVKGRGATPARPALESGADTNSASDYLVHGTNTVLHKPKVAGGAFYWASRLDPRSADALYSQSMAWFLEKPSRFNSYVKGSRKLTESGERQWVDSLIYLALVRDPVVIPRVQARLLHRSRGGFRYSRKPAEHAAQLLLEGAYAMALTKYALALDKDSLDAQLVLGRAQAYFLLGKYDSAATAYRHAGTLVSRRDNEKVVVVYQSKAMFEYSAGNALVMAGDVRGAQEAYGRAIAEDLAFYMAHVRLGDLAMIARDSTTAFSEYETAIGLRGSDPVIRLDYGDVLLAFGKREAAARQYREAIALEPLYAPAHLALARVEDAMGNAERARDAFGVFIGLAPRFDQSLSGARKRFAELSAHTR